MKTTSYGMDIISYLAPKIWDLIPEEIQNSKSLGNFKMKIRLWVPDKWSCNLCKVYVQNVGYLNSYFLVYNIFIVLLAYIVNFN